MDFLNFLMALSPIVVVLVGILGFKKSAKTVSPIALVWTLILAFTYFNVTGASFADNVKALDPLVWKGIKEGLKIVLMVFGAFIGVWFVRILQTSDAILSLKQSGNWVALQGVELLTMLVAAAFGALFSLLLSFAASSSGAAPAR